MGSLIKAIQRLEAQIEADRRQIKESKALIQRALKARLGRPSTVFLAFGGGMVLGWLYHRRLSPGKIPSARQLTPFILPMWEWWWRP